MTTLGIVSSYSDSCGNAAFTRVLKRTIEQYSDVTVEVVDLDLQLLQSLDRSVRKVADRYVAEICERLRGFDAVNIQLEASLYGTLPRDIYRRLSRMMRANPRTSITLHSPRIIEAGSQLRSAIKDALALKIGSAIRTFVTSLKGSVHVRLNRRLIRAMIANNCRAIVHTERAKRQIQALFGYGNVVVHPLRIVGEGFEPRRDVLDSLRAQLGLNPDRKLVGVFGYLSSNKGHLDALEAMKLLPAHYVLLIFGRQHPQTIKTDGKRDGYLARLIETVQESEELRGRVIFMGELPDDDFLQVAANIDVAWLPYYENGQDGSGIASICMDVAPRVLASASFAFDELLRLIPYSNVMRFDIGNEIELASKTEMILERPVPSKPFGDESRFSIRSQAMIYADAAKAAASGR